MLPLQNVASLPAILNGHHCHEWLPYTLTTSAYLHTYMLTYIHQHMGTYLLHIHLYTNGKTYLATYTYLHTYSHTYVNTWILIYYLHLYASGKAYMSTYNTIYQRITQKNNMRLLSGYNKLKIKIWYKEMHAFTY